LKALGRQTKIVSIISMQAFFSIASSISIDNSSLPFFAVYQGSSWKSFFKTV